jgi:hypothetical protein
MTYLFSQTASEHYFIATIKQFGESYVIQSILASDDKNLFFSVGQHIFPYASDIVSSKEVIERIFIREWRKND